MKTFKQFIKETYVNLYGKQQHPIHDAAWDMVQKSYQPIGGIKGSGFSSKDDMVNNISIKMTKRGSAATSGVYYKNKGGRKIVAVSTNQTPEGKRDLSHTLSAEFKTKRSYIEASGPLLHMLVRNLGPDIHNHLIHPSDAHNFINDKVSPAPADDPLVQQYPHLKDHLYRREINGHTMTKLMLGHKAPPINRG